MCAGLTTSSTPKWNERRLLIFTEYEDTRRWIERHLKEAIAHSSYASQRIAVFSGATKREKRQEIKNAFNKETQMIYYGFSLQPVLHVKA